jgi:hypothetical protein
MQKTNTTRYFNESSSSAKPGEDFPARGIYLGWMERRDSILGPYKRHQNFLPGLPIFCVTKAHAHNRRMHDKSDEAGMTVTHLGAPSDLVKVIEQTRHWQEISLSAIRCEYLCYRCMILDVRFANRPRKLRLTSPVELSAILPLSGCGRVARDPGAAKHIAGRMRAPSPRCLDLSYGSAQEKTGCQCLGEISPFILDCALQSGSEACLTSRQQNLGSRVAKGARPQR